MPTHPRRWLPWVVAFTAATFLTALSVTQQYASNLLEDLPTNWGRLIAGAALNWFAWAPVAPIVFVVGPRIVARPGRARQINAWIGVAVVLLLAHTLLETLGARALGLAGLTMSYPTMLWARYSSTLAPNLMVLGTVVFAFYAAFQFQEGRARELRESQLKAELAEAQVAVLRMRLQPHFLFNALHTVSALMEEDVEDARRVLARLSDLLRLSLNQGEANEVTLADELVFLESYIEIQRVRFRDRLTVTLDIAPETREALVPSLLLQPLVENAIRHGIEPRGTPGVVEVRAARLGSELQIDICDDGPGIPPGGITRPGIGLSNTRARLERLYGGLHRFELVNQPTGGLKVTICVPYHHD